MTGPSPKIWHDHTLNHMDALLDKVKPLAASEYGTTHFFEDAVRDHYGGNFYDKPSKWDQVCHSPTHGHEQRPPGVIFDKMP